MTTCCIDDDYKSISDFNWINLKNTIVRRTEGNSCARRYLRGTLHNPGAHEAPRGTGQSAIRSAARRVRGAPGKIQTGLYELCA